MGHSWQRYWSGIAGSYPRCYIQYANKFGKLNSGQRTGKYQSTSQSQRRAVPNNAPTIVQLHSFHTPARLCSKSSKVGFSNMWTENSQKYKLDSEEAEALETKLLTCAGLWRKPESSRKTSTSASLTTQKPLTVRTTANYGKSLKKWGFLITLSIYWEIYMWDRKQQLELDME